VPPSTPGTPVSRICSWSPNPPYSTTKLSAHLTLASSVPLVTETCPPRRPRPCCTSYQDGCCCKICGIYWASCIRSHFFGRIILMSPPMPVLDMKKTSGINCKQFSIPEKDSATEDVKCGRAEEMWYPLRNLVTPSAWAKMMLCCGSTYRTTWHPLQLKWCMPMTMRRLKVDDYCKQGVIGAAQLPMLSYTYSACNNHGDDRFVLPRASF